MILKREDLFLSYNKEVIILSQALFPTLTSEQAEYQIIDDLTRLCQTYQIQGDNEEEKQNNSELAISTLCSYMYLLGKNSKNIGL